jgi:uncharacterized RDD family membrane protein YckC
VTIPDYPSTRELPFDTASWGRRLLALLVDFVACFLVTRIFYGWDFAGQAGGASGWVSLGIFFVESTVFISLAGGTFGQMATRLRVVRIDGDPRPLDPLRSLARQILVSIAIPPLIFRSDGRGLHDLAVGTATVELTTYRRVFRGLPD